MNLSVPTELSSIKRFAVLNRVSPNAAHPRAFIIRSFKEGGLLCEPADSRKNSHIKLPRKAHTADSVKSNLFALAIEK